YLDHPAMDVVDLDFRTSFRDIAKRDDAYRGRGDNPPAFGLSQNIFGELGHLEAAIDRFAEGGRAEGFERKPELERAEAARELHAVIVVIDLFLFGALGVFQNAGHSVKGLFEQQRVACENAADLERLEEPFVRVERERIGALDSRQEFSSSFAQAGRR